MDITPNTHPTTRCFKGKNMTKISMLTYVRTISKYTYENSFGKSWTSELRLYHILADFTSPYLRKKMDDVNFA